MPAFLTLTIADIAKGDDVPLSIPALVSFPWAISSPPRESNSYSSWLLPDHCVHCLCRKRSALRSIPPLYLLAVLLTFWLLSHSEKTLGAPNSHPHLHPRNFHHLHCPGTDIDLTDINSLLFALTLQVLSSASLTTRSTSFLQPVIAIITTWT